MKRFFIMPFTEGMSFNAKGPHGRWVAVNHPVSVSNLLILPFHKDKPGTYELKH